MAFKFWDALGYVDEVVALAAAVAGYTQHKDESVLADQVTQIALDAARQAVGGDISGVDEEKIRQGIVMIVDGLEPIF